LNCAEVFGTFNQVTTQSLAAGTKVTVAIDGVGGSNCQYTITAFNAYGVLAEGFKNFSVWTKASSNIVRWTVENDDGLYYEVERSGNGRDFQTIGRLSRNKSSQYSFEDLYPNAENFYRIKEMKNNGQILFSETIESKRDDLPKVQLRLLTVANQNLDLKIEAASPGIFEYAVMNCNGQVLLKGKCNLSRGTNRLKKNISFLPSGKYFINLYDGSNQMGRQFIKMN